MNARQQEIIAELRRVAELLNTETLSQREFRQHSDLSVTGIENKFGSWNRAIEAAGLKSNPARTIGRKPVLQLSDDELLHEIIRLSSELRKIPTERELIAFGRVSLKPYRKRWGTLREAVEVAFDKFGVPEAISETDLLAPVSQPAKPKNVLDRTVSSPVSVAKPRTSRGKVQYGEPIDFRGLRHAPVNEQGVVYMFGMVSRELGFVIESLRTAYPDCEGKRCVDEKRQLWERVLIEFEFRSSNFHQHGHDPEGCDLIVCWIHDWTDSPLEVIELRSEINRLPKK